MSRENEIWDVEGHTDLLLNVWDKPGFTRGRHRAVLDLTADYVTTDKVMDAGCGMGHFYPVLKNHRPNVEYLGFDNSVEMLKKAHEFFPDMKDFFVLGDIYNMASLPNYPTITCIDILIHLPELESAVQELWKHTEKELIIVTRISPKPSLAKTPYSGQLQLPEGKKLINRGDTRETYQEIFSRLPGKFVIDEKIYDERSTLFRLTREE